MWSVSLIRWSLLFVAFVTMWCGTLGTPTHQEDIPRFLQKRNSRQRARGRPGRYRNRFDFRRFLQQSSMPVTNWSRYAPNPPSAEEVDCEIEVEVVQLVGGRCVRLGGTSGPAVCQSGIHLDIWSGSCLDIINQREAEAARATRTALTADTTGTDNSGTTASSTSP